MIYSYPSLFKSLQPMTRQTSVEMCSLPTGTLPIARAVSSLKLARRWQDPSWSDLPSPVSVPVSPQMTTVSRAPPAAARLLQFRAIREERRG